MNRVLHLLKMLTIRILGMDRARALRRRCLAALDKWDDMAPGAGRRHRRVVEQGLYARKFSIPVDMSRMNVAFIVPQPEAGSGGYRNICRAAKQLRERGHPVTLYYVDSLLSPAGVRSRIGSWYFDIGDVDIVRYREKMGGHDICFATWWRTAYILQKHRKDIGIPCYFVQDFEPSFYPMGTDYLLAEATYRLGFHHFCSGPWCANIIKQRYGGKACHFEFPINREVYHDCYPITRNGRRLVFFARPEMERRCFSLGVEALAHFHRIRPDVEISLYGSKRIPRFGIPFSHKNLGLLPSLSDLAALYAGADLGVAFSPTNPSLVPYEMMACGCAVGDLSTDDAALKYGKEENVFLLDSKPRRIGEELADIFSNENTIREVAVRGKKYVQTSFLSEREFGSCLESLIKSEIENIFS